MDNGEGKSPDRTITRNIHDFAAHIPRLTNFCFKILKNRSDAEDAVQTAVMKAIRNQDFRGESSFYTYLCEIAKNEALQKLKRAEREIPYIAEDEASGIDPQALRLAERYDSTWFRDEGSRRAWEAMQKEVLPRVIRRMGLRFQQALTEYLIRDTADGELSPNAQELNLTTKQFKMLQRKARRIYREEKKRYFDRH